jgi:hypothetical protein
LFFQYLPTSLLCEYTTVEALKIDSISWFKDDLPIEPKILNTGLTEDGKRLNFKTPVTQIHNGLYRCEVKLMANEVIYDSNSYKIQV